MTFEVNSTHGISRVQLYIEGHIYIVTHTDIGVSHTENVVHSGRAHRHVDGRGDELSTRHGLILVTQELQSDHTGSCT